MSDPVIWGPIGWRVLFRLAKYVDLQVAESSEHSLDVAKKMQKLVTLMTFCWPCDQCSFYGVEYTVACPPSLSLFSDYLYDMKGTVDAKIKTLYYKKCMLSECITPHLSRIEFYKRMSLEEGCDARDWIKIFALSLRHAEGHQDSLLRMMALNQAAQIVSSLCGLETLDTMKGLSDGLLQLQRWGAGEKFLSAWIEGAYRD